MLPRFIDGTAVLRQWTKLKLDYADRTHLVLLESATKASFDTQAATHVILSGADGEREGGVSDHGFERDPDPAAPQTREHRQLGKADDSDKKWPSCSSCIAVSFRQ